ncbi:MAG: methionine--tRNA ligase, partial [Deltaproteobacteria bacterium]|nr:methionine--tRNA ligase [Deltaproteobacteria bacterium]
GSFYITTAIDYVNSLPHIGTAYEKIGSDILARWRRFKGDKVRFQMGNDEHSTNVIKAAKKKGLAPQKYCDEMRKEFENIWKKLNISYDDFIQTSEPRHIKGVQALFQKIYDAGDIYKSHYEGWYCESCEAFYTEKDLAGGVCPNHKVKPAWIKEENWFFALSKYQQKILDYIDKHPEFIEPIGRRNEVISMVKQGLQDISVSRSGFEWGIPVPFDKTHVVYVWFDALVNYITAAGFGTKPALFKKLWPASVHVIGKDIIRFHCVIWPAMLMSAGLPLPKTVFAHGFVYLKGEKMSKSLGNIVTPLDVIDKYGADSLRYYLMRSAPFGRDADFTWENFIERYNADLANGIGNLVARTRGMIERYFKGKIPTSKPDKNLSWTIKEIEPKVATALDYANGDLQFHLALAAIMDGVSAADKYINDNLPWELAKKGDTKKLAGVLANVYISIEIISELLSPFMPETSEKISRQMGFGKKKIGSAENLFPRIEKEKKEPKMDKPTGERGSGLASASDLIDITDFAKVDLRVAEVKSAERIEGADRLLKLQIDVGGENRQIVAGIAKHYTPESLVGRKIIVVANLKPAKLRGVESQGMLLCASTADSVVFLAPEKDMPAGSKVK